jgi:hypothetical protein
MAWKNGWVMARGHASMTPGMATLDHSAKERRDVTNLMIPLPNPWAIGKR